MKKRKSDLKSKTQQSGDAATPLEEVFKNPDWFDQFINPPLEVYKGELQYDAKVWLAERESDENLKEPFDLMIALAIICARHVTAILLLLRDLKGLCDSSRSSFTERWMLCSGLYVLSAVNQRLRCLPDDDWNRWPVTRESHCFGIHKLSTLLALATFCTVVEVAAFKLIFRWVWSVTGRPVDCEPVLDVIGNTVRDAGVLNFIQWSHKFNLDVFMGSELFPWSGDVRFHDEIISDEYDLEVELDRVILELEFEHHEAIAGSNKTGEQGKKIRVDPADFKKSKSWNLLKDLLDDDLRQGISINKRRHGEYQPRKLRKILRQKATDKRNTRPQYAKIADAIIPIKGKIHTYKLDVPRQQIDSHRDV